jgi:hypothetical protein
MALYRLTGITSALLCLTCLAGITEQSNRPVLLRALCKELFTEVLVVFMEAILIYCSLKNIALSARLNYTHSIL